MKNEKQLRRTIFLWQLFCLLLLGLLIFYAQEAKASTIDLAPSSQNVVKGEIFYVRAFVNPEGANYTVNLKMNVTGAKLVSWRTSNSWLNLPVKYYWEDFDWGISRTAGYPGGFNTRRYFGTAVFEALESGPVNVSLREDSLILNGGNKNVFEL